MVANREQGLNVLSIYNYVVLIVIQLIGCALTILNIVVAFAR